MKLVDKPQFDVNSIKVGHSVKVTCHAIGKPKYYSGGSQVDKFSTGNHLLVLAIRPLEIILLTYDKKEVRISVEDVANGNIRIIELVEKEDDDELEK